jgi:hypothetical protein
MVTIHSYISAWKPYIPISQHGNHTFIYLGMETIHSYISAWKPYIPISQHGNILIHISQLENYTHSYIAA